MRDSSLSLSISSQSPVHGVKNINIFSRVMWNFHADFSSGSVLPALFVFAKSMYRKSH